MAQRGWGLLRVSFAMLGGTIFAGLFFIDDAAWRSPSRKEDCFGGLGRAVKFMIGFLTLS